LLGTKLQQAAVAIDAFCLPTPPPQGGTGIPVNTFFAGNFPRPAYPAQADIGLFVFNQHNAVLLVQRGALLGYGKIIMTVHMGIYAAENGRFGIILRLGHGQPRRKGLAVQL